MAKESMIAREQKRIRTVKKYAAKRAALKAVLSDTKKSEEEKQVARLKLQKLPSCLLYTSPSPRDDT